jgi:hypothetical protein
VGTPPPDGGEYEAVLKEARANGFRPISASAYEAEGRRRYAVAMVGDAPGLPWEERHDLPLAEFLKEHDALTARGYRPLLRCCKPTASRIE